VALQPDLVLGFSDLQADIAAELVRAGLEVHVFNHRSVADILRMIRTLGGMIGCEGKAQALVAELGAGLAQVRARAAGLARRPRVYFEEWDDPMISGIQWVSELVTLAGGEECFPELAREGWGAIASSPIRWKCRGALPTSCSAPGAARSSSRSAWLRGPGGTPFRRCATATCARSSHPSSCSPDPRR